MLRFLLVTAISLALTFDVSAQGWQEDYQRAQNSYDADSLVNAFSFASSSLEKYQDAGGQANNNYAAILRLLSNICFLQLKFDVGLDFINREIEIRKSKKDTTYATALDNKAEFQSAMLDHGHAIATLNECRSVLLEYYKETDLRVLDCDTKLGLNYYYQDELVKANQILTGVVNRLSKDQAERVETFKALYYCGMARLESGNISSAREAFEKARTMLEAADLKGSVNYFMILFGTGQVDYEERQYTEAERHLHLAQDGYAREAGKDATYYDIVGKRTISLLKSGKVAEAEVLLKELGSNSEGADAYARSVGNFAAIAQEQGDVEKAESLYRDALSRYKQKQKSSTSYAEIIENVAMLKFEAGKFDDAFMLLTEAKAIVEKVPGSTSREYASLLAKFGKVQTQRGNLVEATQAFREAQVIIGKLSTEVFAEKLSVLGGMGDLEQRKGNFQGADSLFNAALALYKSGVAIDRSYLLILNKAAASKQIQGDVMETNRLVGVWVAGTGRLEGKASVAYANALATLGGMNLRSGDPLLGKMRLDSSILILEKSSGKQSVEYGHVLMDVGRYYQLTGDYTGAEPYLRNAREIMRARKGEQSIEYANALNSLAILYQTLGNYRDAEPLLKESRAIIEKVKGKSSAEYSTSLQNLATLYQSQLKYDQARPLLEEALEIDKRALGDRHPLYAITLQNLATLYQKSKSLPEAQMMLEKVLEVNAHTLGKEHPSYATTLSNLAALYQDQGKFAEAEATWKLSVALRKKILGENHPDYARSLFGLAGVYHARGMWEEARKYYTPVVASYLRQVHEFFPSLSEKEKSAFYAKIKPVFDAYQDFCMQYLTQHPEQKPALLRELYDLQLSTKAILLNSTNKVRATILSSGNKELIDLFQEWLRAKEEIVHYRNNTEAERLRSTVDAAALDARANDLEKRLSEQSSAFHSEFDKEQVTWKDVQKNLHDHEAAVEIIRIRKKYTVDSVYYAGLVVRSTGDAPELTIWNQGALLEGRRFKYHRNTIKFHIADTMSYELFWQPLADRLNGITTVYLSCDGVFNKVNFNSLYNTKTNHWVLDDFTIRQVSNSKELAQHRTSDATGLSGILFGFADFKLSATISAQSMIPNRQVGRSFGFDAEEIPILPATEKEVDEVARTLRTHQWKVENFKKQEATEENLKKEESPRLLHIATHGFFLSDLDISENEDDLLSNPLFRSGVLLAGAAVDRSASKREEDGVLTAYEAMNLHLDQTELVVLSACETGLGEVRNGEGVYGLQRSFLVAGASTVLMSLWQVDDVATQELMNSFYSFWLTGMDKHQAFRNAQLAMKEKYKVPYFWGAFVLIGY